MPKQRTRLAPRTPARERQPLSFTLEDITQRDFFVALGIWVILEVLGLVLFPALGLIQPGDRLNGWIATSVPVGVIGAFLVGASSQYINVTVDRADRTNKPLQILLGQAVGWLGLAGVLFPLLVVAVEFFTKTLGKAG
ncbi:MULTISPECIES: hypothetical protein [Trichocoleus]|uniref:Uncharacterized protein n=1 Tax=Trichocoleus desertorum GB2-A4 TaxID=2933944 RepID=A0ABV0JA89_9CYAN|nr:MULTISPECIES: hypothetical protein [unclassified Trichocoleus]MBD1862908.1 hypothetical protein [Trichocoleus sp. FACHB-46]MBD2124411.1 hypothetical protein [Trichocoleus sp. FACHB-262]